MRKFNLKPAFAAVLTFVMILSVCGIGINAAAQGGASSAVTVSKTDDEYQLMAEQSGLKLFLNPKTTNFYVEDTVTEKRFYAFPEDAGSDITATPAYKIEMQAALVFTLWDPVKKTETRKNSNAASVAQGNYEIRRQNNGFIIDYDLKTSYISASLSVVLDNGKLICSLPQDSVNEQDTTRIQILRIAVLPFMISGSAGSDGGIILPDGCGEILDFSTERSAAEAYQKTIYGRNLTTTLSVEEKTGYDITCPYLALRAGDTGALAIPVKGAVVGYVNANPAGKSSSYANAWFSFQYRAVDLAIIGDRADAFSQNVQAIDTQTYSDEIAVSFEFMFENATLYNLARRYGEYLSPGSKAAQQNDYPAVFDIYGFVNEKKSFLGFPYTALSVLSKAEDIIAFASHEAFVGTAINLKNVTADHQKYRLNTTLKPVSKVLNRSQLKRLTAGAVSVYVNANPLTFRRNSFTANSFFSASKTIYGAPAMLYDYKESTHLINNDAGKRFLLKYGKIPQIMSKLMESAQKTGIDGMSSDELAAISYHDYSSDGTIENTRTAQEQACASAAEKTGLMLENPCDYAIAYCTVLLDIPVDSSNNDLCSGEYPFIQMALGDSIPYTVEPINLYRSPEVLFLKALATGSSLHYSFVLSNSKSLIGSDLNFLYSADYSSFRESVDEQVAAYNEIRNATENSGLAGYNDDGDTVTAVFENGVTVTVKLSDKTYKVSK